MTLENWSFSGNNLISGPATTSLSDYYKSLYPQKVNLPAPIIPSLPSRPVSPTYGSYDTSRSYNLTGGNSGIDMNSIMQKILSTSPQINTTQVQTQQQNQSPELENLMNEFRNRINTIGADTQAAYQGKSNTYSDLLASLANMYGAMAGGQSGAASTSALASGLTPLEATQAGNDVLNQVMQQYFPQRAGLTAEQAQVGVDLQSQLAALEQSLGLPLLQNIESPYWQNVAGNTTTTNSTTTDPYRQLSLLAQLAQFQQQQQSSDALGWAQLQQNANQFSQNLGQRQYEFGQGYLNDIQKLLQQQSMEQYKTNTGLGLEYNKMANDTALQQYLQQLRGTQGMDQILAQITGNIGLEQLRGQQGLQNIQTQIQGYGQNTMNNTMLEYMLKMLGMQSAGGFDDIGAFIDSL